MSLGGGDLQVILRRIRHGKSFLSQSISCHSVWSVGFIICDDTELCDKIISQDVENEQRRRTLAKSFVDYLYHPFDVLLSFLIRKAIDIEKSDLLTLLRTEPDFILNELSHSPEWTATNVQGLFMFFSSSFSFFLNQSEHVTNNLFKDHSNEYLNHRKPLSVFLSVSFSFFSLKAAHQWSLTPSLNARSATRLLKKKLLHSISIKSIWHTFMIDLTPDDFTLFSQQLIHLSIQPFHAVSSCLFHSFIHSSSPFDLNSRLEYLSDEKSSKSSLFFCKVIACRYQDTRYGWIRIYTDLVILVRRVRCETLGRLDEIKNENEAKRKVQVISWQHLPSAQHNTKSKSVFSSSSHLSFDIQLQMN